MDTTLVQVQIGKDVVDLADVKIHKDWKFNKGSYDADIAVLTLFNPVSISSAVQPICLSPRGTGDIVVPGGVFVSLELLNETKKALMKACFTGWCKRD